MVAHDWEELGGIRALSIVLWWGDLHLPGGGLVGAVLCLTAMFNASVAFDKGDSVGTDLVNAFAAESAKGNSLAHIDAIVASLGKTSRPCYSLSRLRIFPKISYFF